MLRNRPQLILGLILCTACFASGIKEDTARLAQHLKQPRIRRSLAMPQGDFISIQKEYLAWIDSRVKTGASVATMNEELAAAHLLSDGPQTVDGMFDRTYAGFLGKIERKRAAMENDPFAITFGIHTGGYCNFDETIVLYAQDTLRRIARINAEASYTHGYRLRDFDVGRDDTSRGRMIGSAWVAANCTVPPQLEVEGAFCR